MTQYTQGFATIVRSSTEGNRNRVQGLRCIIPAYGMVRGRVLAVALTLVYAAPNAHAVCAHDITLQGDAITTSHMALQSAGHDMYVAIDGRYQKWTPKMRLDANTYYPVQLVPVSVGIAEQNLEYYSYQRMSDYLAVIAPKLEPLGYRLEVIGQSVEGRNLWAVFPRKLDPTRAPVLMAGRQHGNEGTANWIIEGFLNALFDGSPAAERWHRTYQLVLYPMVNPDGAEARTRYNANGYDLNRTWSTNPTAEVDEVALVHEHLNGLNLEPLVISLDMHGSVSDDFIYRVSSSYRGREFYTLQQGFIDSLGSYDRWQAGSYQTSNGRQGMLRILLIESAQVNAFTHETPREIPVDNGEGRSIATLRAQGQALVDTLLNY